MGDLQAHRTLAPNPTLNLTKRLARIVKLLYHLQP